MNVTIPETIKLKKKQKIIYISIIAFCIIAIIMAFYVQFYARLDYLEMLGIKQSEYGKLDEERAETLKSNFDSLFNNNVQNVSEKNNEKRKDKEKSIVYTSLEKKDVKQNNYDIDVHIPYINVENESVDKINKEIESVFTAKANSLLNSENKNAIYMVTYTANIEYDILSVMIKANLKEGTSAQRLIIQTYNYDLRNNKEIDLEEVLRIRNIEISTMQNKINKEVEKEEKKVEDLKSLGYNIYNRDTSSDIYKVENTKTFYVTNEAVYVIYAYGNDAFTSEKDLIVV